MFKSLFILSTPSLVTSWMKVTSDAWLEGSCWLRKSQTRRSYLYDTCFRIVRWRNSFSIWLSSVNAEVSVCGSFPGHSRVLKVVWSAPLSGKNTSSSSATSSRVVGTMIVFEESAELWVERVDLSPVISAASAIWACAKVAYIQSFERQNSSKRLRQSYMLNNVIMNCNCPF